MEVKLQLFYLSSSYYSRFRFALLKCQGLILAYLGVAVVPSALSLLLLLLKLSGHRYSCGRHPNADSHTHFKLYIWLHQYTGKLVNISFNNYHVFLSSIMPFFLSCIHFLIVHVFLIVSTVTIWVSLRFLLLLKNL